MQRKWLLDYEVKEARKLAKSKTPQRNKNQEKEGTTKAAERQNLSEEDRQHVRSYSVLMPLASRSVNKLDQVLLKATTVDSRDSGIGNFGGHIARELRLPGPLNGKDVYDQSDGCVTSPFYVKLKKRKVKPPPLSADDLNPPWDKNFVNDHQAREKMRREERDQQYLLLKLEMQTFLSRMCCSRDEGRDEVSPAASSMVGRNYSFPRPLPDEALDEWAEMLQELWRTAADVANNDLMEISSWVKPPPAAVDILGYLCILLGVNPDWASAKRLLLRNIPSLQNFIRKIEPRQIPMDRVLQASRWREEHIPVLSHVGMAKVNQSLSKLTRWVLMFNRMVSFYLCAIEDDGDSLSTSVMTSVKEKNGGKRAENRRKEAEKLSKGASSKQLLSEKELPRGDSKRNLRRGSSKRSIKNENGRELQLLPVSDSGNPVNMHELITRNTSRSFSRDHEEFGSVVTEIDFVAAAKAFEEDSQPPSRDPILGRRRVSVVSQILEQDNRKISSEKKSVKLSGDDSCESGRKTAQSSPRPASGKRSDSSIDHDDVIDTTTSVATEKSTPDFEAQFWKSIGAAFMLDDTGKIILSNGKDIGLYQDMLLGDETVTSDYSKHKLSGSDLALTTRRRKIVAENRDMIHSFVGTLIRQVSKEYIETNS